MQSFRTVTRKSQIVALIGSVLVSLTCAQSALAKGPENGGRHDQPINIANVGFETPESVLYDRASDVYLVSNINGAGLAPDNNGFISRVSPNGTVIALKWIEGGVTGVTLNAPKGSAIANGTLYVADINYLRKFDAKTGQPTGSILFPNATFLNDVASDKQGTVYVSDIGFKLNATSTDIEPSGTDAIYKVDRNDVVSVVAQGNALLHHPNGLAVLKDGSLQATSYDPFDGTQEIYTISKQGVRSNTIAMPAGLLDGVVVIEKRNLLVSSWQTGTIYQVSRKGVVTEVATGLPQPADIGYDTKRERILVPIFGENRVVIWPLDD